MSWIKNKTQRESLEILRDISAVCDSLGGPLTHEIFDLVCKEDYKSLVNYDIDYASVDVNDAIYARQILALYQKLDFLNLGYDRQKVAAQRFVDSEEMCFDTNQRYQKVARGELRVPPVLSSVFHIAQQKIAAVLGSLPSVEEFTFSFGPGANTNVKGAEACPRAKLSAPLECSTSMTETVGELLSEVPHWAALHAVSEDENLWNINVRVAPGKVMFVPKNAKTDRTIVVEPILNGFFQKGVGDYIRGRLLRFGVDLRDQTRNQKLACQGSTDGLLATVDLSMASDCISRSVVWDLLPLDWAVFLDQLRTPTVTLPDEIVSGIEISPKMVPVWGEYVETGVHTLEKFSSMGNAFTFELESLIFWGLTSAVVEMKREGFWTKYHEPDPIFSPESVSVYGDDIILPCKAYDLLQATLEWAGFRINHSKSFHTGSFRESCGADYFKGIDIRPFYQKSLISERTLFTMHNWFIRHGERKLARAVEQLCNPCYRIYGPDGYGDGHLIGDFPFRTNRQSRRFGWEGSYFDTYVLRTKRLKGLLPGDAVLPVYSVYTRSGKDSPTDPDVIRGSRGYAKISIYTLARSIFSRKP